MKNAILSNLLGSISLFVLVINTTFWVTALALVTVFKIIIPFGFSRKFWGKIAIIVANSWISVNNSWLIHARKLEFDVEGLQDLRLDKWYLVISNHQSWVDIPILQKVFYKKIPFLKFFLKKELIWVPLLGPAWWALDFPFMKRYKPSFLKKHPHLKGKDMEITRKACEKFKDIPVSVMNFIEGTRFSEEKKIKQKSKYDNLLRPKSGGVGFVMSAMGHQLSNILNVTISYPDGVEEMWAFLCGKVKRVKVKIEVLPVTESLIGDYTDDPEYRKRFQKWLNDLWEQKDAYLSSTKRLN